MNEDGINDNPGTARMNWEDLRLELEELDNEFVEAEGIRLKPSQCYRVTDPALNVIYNTNCPDSLREKVESILKKYSNGDENYPPEDKFYFP